MGRWAHTRPAREERCTKDGCPLKGQVHPRCTGHVKGTREDRADRRGQPCGNWPMTGQDVCALHGGKSQQARKAAVERVAEGKALAAVAAFGLPRDVSPTEALLEEVRWSAGHVAWLRDRIAERGEAPTRELVTPEGRALLDLYGEERDRLVRISKTTLDAGVEERRVQLAESQGALVAGAIRRILVRLNLTPEQELLVGTVVPTELRALAGGAA
jgi:hypothetical protein